MNGQPDIMLNKAYMEMLGGADVISEPESFDKKNRLKKCIKGIGSLAAGLTLAAALFFGGAGCGSNNEQASNAEVEVSPEDKEKTIEDIVRQELYNNGWPEGSFIIGDVDPSIDISTAGDGRFSSERIQSPQAMVDFLNTDSRSAILVSEQIKAETGATEYEIKDPSNWVAVQYLLPVIYDNNTALINGEVVNAGSRLSESGSIDLYFVDPTDDEVDPTNNGIDPADDGVDQSEDNVSSTRGACANRQATTPRPMIPGDNIPSDKQDEGKSSNPDDYAYPEDKPPVPPVTTPPDEFPPEVVTEQPGGGGVVDTPTNQPGSESGVTAPGATPPDENSNTPQPENGVNPSDGVNQGDPGLPSGF